MRRHVEGNRRRQLVRRCVGVALVLLPRQFESIDGLRGAMGEQRQDAGMVQPGEKPQSSATSRGMSAAHPA